MCVFKLCTFRGHELNWDLKSITDSLTQLTHQTERKLLMFWSKYDKLAASDINMQLVQRQTAGISLERASVHATFLSTCLCCKKILNI